MEIGNDPDFGNTHGEALFEYYVRIEGEDVTRSVAQKELALWIHMVALELGKTKLAGEAGTYAKRLIDEGYDTVQGLAELDIEDLVEAGMRKGDAKLIMGRVSQKCTSSGGEGSAIALAPRCEAANWNAIESCNTFNDWRRGHELWSSGHPKTMGSLSN